MEELTHGWRQDINYAKLGYFRTDDETTQRIASALRPSECEQRDAITLLDPCCGEGLAAAFLGQAWEATTFGVEYDEDRYQAAHQRLDHVLNADALGGTFTSNAWASVMLFNPPYGDARKEREGDKSARLEALFWESWAKKLKRGGVMIAILPVGVFAKAPGLVRAMSHFFSGQRFAIYRAAEDTYRQVVIIGYRAEEKGGQPNAAFVRQIGRLANGEFTPEILPESMDDPFVIPDSEPPQTWDALVLTEAMAENAVANEDDSAIMKIEEELAMSQKRYTQNPSVVPLRQGHIPQLLAAGGLDGIIKDKDSTLLVKGVVRRKGVKSAVVSDHESADDSSSRTTTTTIYKWETVIHAWDITPGRGCPLLQIQNQ